MLGVGRSPWRTGRGLSLTTCPAAGGLRARWGQRPGRAGGCRLWGFVLRGSGSCGALGGEGRAQRPPWQVEPRRAGLAPASPWPGARGGCRLRSLPLESGSEARGARLWASWQTREKPRDPRGAKALRAETLVLWDTSRVL